jgi:hypothetical protein
MAATHGADWSVGFRCVHSFKDCTDMGALTGNRRGLKEDLKSLAFPLFKLLGAGLQVTTTFWVASDCRLSSACYTK